MTQAVSGALPARPSRAVRLNRIDALRCIAMTAVFLQHCRLLPCGWIGVWLFYVISGFVVTASLLDSPRLERPLDGLRHFFGRRARRIIPVYAAMVLLGFVVTAAATHRLETATLFSYLLFYNNFVAPFGHVTFGALNTGQLWTVSVEMQFYAIFGFAFFFLSRRKLTSLLIAMIVAAPLLRVVVSALVEDKGAFIVYTASPLHFDAFAGGALMALNRATVLESKNLRRLWIAAAVAIASYGGVYVSYNVFAEHAHGLNAFRNVFSGVMWGQGRQLWSYSVIALASAAVVASAASPHGTNVMSAALDWSPLRWIGVRSYGAYVFHIAVLGAVGAALHLHHHAGRNIAAHLQTGVIAFAIAYPATVVLAALSYRWFEQPIVRGRKPRVAKAAVALSAT
jgi:peptidoglycan/LPS O-acetylase OafA/YrhL